MRLWQQQLMRVLSLVVIVTVVCGTLPARPALAARPAPAVFPQPQRFTPSPQELDPEPIMPSESEPVPDLGPIPPSLPAQAPIVEAPVPRFGDLPLVFVPNVGQHGDRQVQFEVRGGHAHVGFTSDEVQLTLPFVRRDPQPADPGQRPDDPTAAPPAIGLSTVRIRLEGASRRPVVEGTTLLPGVVHFAVGDSPAQLWNDVPTYQGVRYREVYPGIDMVYDGAGGQLKSTYVVAPGADPNQIRWHYLGAQRPVIDEQGNLRLTVPITMPVDPGPPIPDGTDAGQAAAAPAAPPIGATELVTVTEEAPIAWQDINGQRVDVPVAFAIAQNQRVSFTLGAYDAAHSLTIDPTLVYSSFLGGAGDDFGNGIALDAAGNIYVAGQTFSLNFGVSGVRANQDAFVTKINPTGSARLYTTFLIGSGIDSARGIAIDSTGNAYVVGSTQGGLPTTSAYQAAHGGNTDALVAKLSPTGAITMLGYVGGSGSDFATAVAVNSAGQMHILGQTSTNNLNTVNAFLPDYGGGTQDMFVLKLTASGTSPVYFTYAGGTDLDFPGRNGIALDSSGNAYITGHSSYRAGYLTTFLMQSNGNPVWSGASILKLSSSGTRTYGTVFGHQQGEGVVVDANGVVYVAGWTGALLPCPQALTSPCAKAEVMLF